MKYRWTIAAPQLDLAQTLSQRLGIASLLAQCLLNRGLCDPEAIGRFIEPRLKDLADPFLLPDMERAVDRFCIARKRGEHVVVFGDYDVDGVTSTALLVEFLREFGWKADYYLPSRMDEGYGLTETGVRNCLEKFPATLLLAADCGSKAGPSMDWLAGRGVDVVVLDHHQISDPPPQVAALVNPQAGLERPAFRELCTVGLAFKFAHALLKRGRDENWPGALDLDLRKWLDLVALGTIADIVPLIGENRILVTAGLSHLTNTKRPGLVALKAVAGIDGRVGGYEVGFQLGPRLNAAGRLESALDALHLILARDPVEASELAAALDRQNRDRQAIERKMAEQVLGRVSAKFRPETDFALVEEDFGWHVGVVGIVASRIVQEHYRPTIILGGDGAQYRGSGRSIEGFDLAGALRECGDLLVRHGGHAMAAGVTIEPDRLDAFRARFNELVRKALSSEQLQPRLRIDAPVNGNELTLPLIQDLERLQQTGVGNPPVQLMMRNVTHQRPMQRMGAEKQHVKFWVSDGTATREAVWWRAANRPLPSGAFDLAFVPQVNHFNGATSVQLKVLDWRPAQ